MVEAYPMGERRWPEDRHGVFRCFERSEDSQCVEEDRKTGSVRSLDLFCKQIRFDDGGQFRGCAKAKARSTHHMARWYQC